MNRFLRHYIDSPGKNLSLVAIAIMVSNSSVVSSEEAQVTIKAQKEKSLLSAVHPGLSISAVSDVENITAGKPFRMGVHIKHQDGYHTYWKNPGAVGFSTQFKWKLPQGFTVSDIHWPAPEKSLMTTVKCNGYARDVTLYVDITPPAELKSEVVAIEFTASWMCCGKECNPGTQLFKKQFAVGAKTIEDKAGAALIESSRLQQPSRTSPIKVKVLSQANENAVVFLLSSTEAIPMKKIQIFSADNQLDSNAKRHITSDSEGNLRVSVRRSEFSPKSAKSLPLVIVLNGKAYQTNTLYE